MNNNVGSLRSLSGFFLALMFGLFLSVPLFAEPAREPDSPSANGPAQLSPLQPAPPRQMPELPRINNPWMNQDQDTEDPVQVSVPPELPVPESGPRFAVIPARVRPGEPITVAYTDEFSGPGSRDFQAVLLNPRGTRVGRAPLVSFTYTPEGQELKAAFLAVPSTVASGVFTVRIEAGGRIIQDILLIVEPRDFVAEVIELDQRNTEIRVAPNPQRDRESEILWAILSRTGTDFYYGGYFIPPVTSTRRTSFYGDRRVYAYVDGSTETSIHAGVDYGVPTGTEVWACAAGRVILAVSRISTGNSVILEHLPGVYSLYYHLDSIIAEEGSMVRAGQLLGLSGSTGLSTGPHLHWEIRVAGENADPDAFVSRPVLDKDEILRNLIKYN
ncbi:MAG: peptidoglycan DD-metalloendopeptidase family protein [Treponema sp.]|nr:peptidoglycan DD-metalloendopeptidase family protein [Treponema sp.]